MTTTVSSVALPRYQHLPTKEFYLENVLMTLSRYLQSSDDRKAIKQTSNISTNKLLVPLSHQHAIISIPFPKVIGRQKARPRLVLLIGAQHTCRSTEI